MFISLFFSLFFFSSRRRHTRCALLTGVQTCALPIFTVGSITLNHSPVDLSKFRPVARLTAEHLVLAVKADSPYKTLGDFAAALKANPGATAVGGGSAGGVDHIALALLAQSAGAPEIGRASCRERVCQYV